MFKNVGEEILKPVLLNEAYTLSVDYLVRLMDSSDIKFSYDVKPEESVIGDVFIFMRTFSENLTIQSKDIKQCIFSCPVYNEQGQPCIPSEMTLNDFVLIQCRNLIRKVFSGATDEALVVNAFPTPFGVYYDSEKKCNVAVIQLCVNNMNLKTPSDNFEYVPFDKAPYMEKYLLEHIKRTKN